MQEIDLSNLYQSLITNLSVFTSSTQDEIDTFTQEYNRFLDTGPDTILHLCEFLQHYYSFPDITTEFNFTCITLRYVILKYWDALSMEDQNQCIEHLLELFHNEKFKYQASNLLITISHYPLNTVLIEKLCIILCDYSLDLLFNILTLQIEAYSLFLAIHPELDQFFVNIFARFSDITNPYLISKEFISFIDLFISKSKLVWFNERLYTYTEFCLSCLDQEADQVYLFLSHILQYIEDRGSFGFHFITDEVYNSFDILFHQKIPNLPIPAQITLHYLYFLIQVINFSMIDNYNDLAFSLLPKLPQSLDDSDFDSQQTISTFFTYIGTIYLSLFTNDLIDMEKFEDSLFEMMQDENEKYVIISYLLFSDLLSEYNFSNQDDIVIFLFEEKLQILFSSFPDILLRILTFYEDSVYRSNVFECLCELISTENIETLLPIPYFNTLLENMFTEFDEEDRNNLISILIELLQNNQDVSIQVITLNLLFSLISSHPDLIDEDNISFLFAHITNLELNSSQLLTIILIFSNLFNSQTSTSFLCLFISFAGPIIEEINPIDSTILEIFQCCKLLLQILNNFIGINSDFCDLLLHKWFDFIDNTESPRDSILSCNSNEITHTFLKITITSSAEQYWALENISHYYYDLYQHDPKKINTTGLSILILYVLFLDDTDFVNHIASLDFSQYFQEYYQDEIFAPIRYNLILLICGIVLFNEEYISYNNFDFILSSAISNELPSDASRIQVVCHILAQLLLFSHDYPIDQGILISDMHSLMDIDAFDSLSNALEKSAKSFDDLSTCFPIYEYFVSVLGIEYL